jgi:hypothetical protein
MDAYYADEFVLPLPEGHRFPMAKYRVLRDRIAEELARNPSAYSAHGRRRGFGARAFA